MPIRRALLAVGALAIALVMGACGRLESASSTITSPMPSTTTTPRAGTTSVPVTASLPEASPTTVRETPTTEAVSDAEGVAYSAFQEWVGLLAEGEVMTAWETMAESSRAAWGSSERFAEMGTGLAEGWGSWVAVEGASYFIETDDAGRRLLVVSGTIFPEGHEEQREVAVPLVEEGDRVQVSPYEEFGNVARGLAEPETAGRPPVPDGSGEGRRIVYSNSGQRVWLVEDDGIVRDTYLVSGKEDVPAPGSYEVFSKSELAYAGHDDITMTHMVRFAHGETLPIGFHAIPNDGSGRPIQSEDELGEYRSAGCVRQSPGHAAALYEWAPVGTEVVVLS